MEREFTREQIKDVLGMISADCSEKDWFEVLAAMHNVPGLSDADARSLAEDWSRGYPHYKQSEFNSKWSHTNKQGFSVGTLFNKAGISKSFDPIGIFKGNRGVETYTLPRMIANQKLEALQKVQMEKRKKAKEEQEKAEAEEKARKARESMNAEALCNSLGYIQEHPYLKNKFCGAYSLLDWEGDIVIPIRDIFTDKIISYQKISTSVTEDGDLKTSKLYKKGAQKDNGYFCIPTGSISRVQNLQKICVCEGYATGATIHEATNLPVIVMFDSGNLKKSLKNIVLRLPASDFLICADDDWRNQSGNIGTESAEKAIGSAKKGKFTSPAFTEEEKKYAMENECKISDFNDLRSVLGYDLETIKARIYQVKDILGDIANPVELQAVEEKLAKFIDDKKGYRSTIESLSIAIRSRVVVGYEFAYDSFTNRHLTKKLGKNKWEPINEELTYLDVIESLEKFNFTYTKLGKDKVKDVIYRVSQENKFDSCVDWLDNNLPEWDGIKRVSRFFRDYIKLDTEESQYDIDIANYLWTAILGRALAVDEPLKVDIVPVFMGKQNQKKSKTTEFLTPIPEWRGELELNNTPADMARLGQGKIIVEIPEAAGKNKKTDDELKCMISKKTDEWIPKFKENAIAANRRMVYIITTNNKKILTDITGSRRFAVLEIDEVHQDMINNDLLQLWAEARVMYEEKGLMWQAMDQWQDSKQRNEKYRIKSEVEEVIREGYLSLCDDNLQYGGQNLTTRYIRETWFCKGEFDRGTRSIKQLNTEIQTTMVALGFEIHRGSFKVETSKAKRPEIWVLDHPDMFDPFFGEVK